MRSRVRLAVLIAALLFSTGVALAQSWDAGKEWTDSKQICYSKRDRHGARRIVPCAAPAVKPLKPDERMGVTTTSTINPAIPAQNSSLSSAPIRGNFQAAYNDITNIYASFSIGGSSGQIQWNNSGAFAGFTMGGDCTLVTSTGIITCTKSGGTAFGTAAFKNTGTSGANVGLLNGANTYSGVSIFSAALNAVTVNLTGVLTVNLNSGSLPTPQTGTIAQLGQVDGTSTRLEVDSSGAAGYFSVVRVDGTQASPTALLANDEIGGFNAWGYNSSAIVGPRGAYRIYANQTWTTGANGTYADVATTPNGATAEVEVIRFENDGGVTVPSTVTGGDKGVGTINAGGLYVNGSAVLTASSGITVGTTPVAGGTTGFVLYDNGGTLGNLNVTGSGNAVLATNPTLAGFTASGITNFTGTFQIGGTSETFPASGLIVGTTDTQTLTNKSIAGSEINSSVVGATFGGTGTNNGSNTLTLGGPLITTGSGTITLAFPNSGVTYTFPTAAATIAGLGTTQTFSGTDTFSGTLNVTGAFQIGGVGVTLPISVANGGTAQITALAARGSSGLNIDSATSTGDANYTILSTDRMVYHTALSAARTDTLPLANSVNAGQEFHLTDFAGVVTASHTITLQRSGSDTINGVTSVVALNAQYGAGIFWSDGASKWTYYPASTGGGSGTVTSVVCGSGLSGGTITTSGTCSLNLGNAQTWTAAQTFTNSDLLLLGSSTGYTTFTSANSSATNYTLTFPAITDTVATLTNLVSAPQGRLTLTSNTPVMVASASAQTTLYYDCYHGGNKVPYYNGTIDLSDTIGSCQVSTAMAASGTGVLNATGVFDVWWVHGGANRICVATNGSGGGWASDTGGSNTARGTGYSQLDTTTRPYVTNANSIAHCYNGTSDYGSVSANQATYLGTIATDSSAGKVSWTLGGTSAGGTAGVLNVWNMYNRVSAAAFSGDSNANWTYATASWAQADASAGNQISYVSGFNEDSIDVKWAITIRGPSSGGNICAAGIGINSTSAFSGANAAIQNVGSSQPQATSAALYQGQVGVGINTVYKLQYAQGGSTCTYLGNNGTGTFFQEGMYFNYRM